jgi:alpha-L-fucosidase
MKNLLFFVALIGAPALHAQTYQPTWQSLDSRPVPQWYKDAKFGIFIHWGVYSVPAFSPIGQYAEWYQYALKDDHDSATIRYQKEKFGDKTYYQMANDFKAELFNPDEWANLFEKSGAKYIVLTSKHHDGFCLWPSKDANRDWGFPWNAVDAGPHRNLLGELFAAVQKTSVHAGMYYSLFEWYDPLWLKDKNAYVTQHMWPQMKELINTYKPDVFWSDGDWMEPDTTWKSQEFLQWLYNESPVKDKVVTYDRWGNDVWGASATAHYGAVYTPEYGTFVNYENHPWEESRGMGFSYGYNRLEDAWDYNSPQALVLQLIDKVSGGGNFLLDIGPDEHGKIPPIMQERLLQIGDWMKINSEAIYSTQRWRMTRQWSKGNFNIKLRNPRSGNSFLQLTVNPDPGNAVIESFFTYNPVQNNLYALLPSWPSNKTFVVHDLQLKPDAKIELLETHQVLPWKQTGSDVEVAFPDFDPGKIKSQYAYVLKFYNSGAFIAKPKVTVNYPAGSLKQLVSIADDGNQSRYTLDGSIPVKNSQLFIKPFFADTSCMLTVRAFKKDKQVSDLVTVPLNVLTWKNAIKTKGIILGLHLNKYVLSSPKSTDELNNAVAEKTVTASAISISDTLRAENTGLIYEGFIKVAKDGIYTFYLSSDDGSKLWIDNETLIDNDGLHGDVEKSKNIALKKGFHAFKLAYIQATGGAALSLEYGLFGGSKRKVPASLFYYPK